jgi:hypothetical protein
MEQIKFYVSHPVRGLSLFKIVVAVQSDFRLEMHQNNIFLTSGPVGLVEVRASWPEHPR